MKVQKSSNPCRFGDLEIISAMAVTGFLPGFLSVAAQYAIVFYLLFCRRTRKIVFSSKTALWLIPLTPVAIIPPFFYQNYLGAVVGAGLVMLAEYAGSFSANGDASGLWFGHSLWQKANRHPKIEAGGSGVFVSLNMERGGIRSDKQVVRQSSVCVAKRTAR